ncbi:MAG: hypothetical protein J0J06_14290 [Sphingomonas sp.]|uniref:hypothetical protein n=1 Tax=Sphingomonas sp. TaxID=28214 RepID=UPI001ACFE96F|nr:hypothetical protein [Sphingomonas sp.]MBN8816602.1 hypothetical protein [Sphingomonas sp.]
MKLAVVAFGITALAGCGVYDQPAVRASLMSYLPEAKCGDAVFSLQDDDRSIRGDGIVSLTTAAPDCVRSVREALKHRGSRNVYYAEGVGGWNIPGRDRLVGDHDVTFQGPHLNLFTFRRDGTMLWQEIIE